MLKKYELRDHVFPSWNLPKPLSMFVFTICFTCLYKSFIYFFYELIISIRRSCNEVKFTCQTMESMARFLWDLNGRGQDMCLTCTDVGRTKRSWFHLLKGLLVTMHRFLKSKHKRGQNVMYHNNNCAIYPEVLC